MSKSAMKRIISAVSTNFDRELSCGMLWKNLWTLWISPWITCKTKQMVVDKKETEKFSPQNDGGIPQESFV